MNPPEQITDRSWQRCWQTLGGEGDGLAMRQALLTAYAEPQRQYHTLQHLEECLTLFERLVLPESSRELTGVPGEVEMALWFHDAVYDVHAFDNEMRSAHWAEKALQAHAVSPARTATVCELILATRHRALPQGRDQMLLVDIDLAILGAPPPRFAEYEKQIRAEYSWVAEPEFRAKRAAILAGFLARPTIYHTEAIRRERDAQARANLTDSVWRLRAL